MQFIAIVLQNGTEDFTGRYLGVFVELYDGYSQTAMLVVYTYWTAACGCIALIFYAPLLYAKIFACV